MLVVILVIILTIILNIYIQSRVRASRSPRARTFPRFAPRGRELANVASLAYGKGATGIWLGAGIDKVKVTVILSLK